MRLRQRQICPALTRPYHRCHLQRRPHRPQHQPIYLPLPPRSHLPRPFLEAPHLPLLPRRRVLRLEPLLALLPQLHQLVSGPSHGDRSIGGLLFGAGAPAAYEDASRTLQWLASHAVEPRPGLEPWLTEQGGISHVFLTGDSIGANIVHNWAMRTKAKIEGVILVHPYFCGSELMGCEKDCLDKTFLEAETLDRLWPFAWGGTTESDDPRVNPMAEGARSLAGLGCGRAGAVGRGGEGCAEGQGQGVLRCIDGEQVGRGGGVGADEGGRTTCFTS